MTAPKWTSAQLDVIARHASMLGYGQGPPPPAYGQSGWFGYLLELVTEVVVAGQ